MSFKELTDIILNYKSSGLTEEQLKEIVRKYNRDNKVFKETPSEMSNCIAEFESTSYEL